MRYFSLGPVAMFPHTMEVASCQVPYFRTPEFSDLMLETDGLFKRCLHAPEDALVMYLTASGTAAMEATVFNCFNGEDRLLIVDGGIFGHRFVQICDKFRIPYDAVHLAFGEVLTESHLAPFEGGSYTALVSNVHETSTGQLYDIEMLSRFSRRNGLYLVIDAISSFLADPYDIGAYGIDATILSSQKGLALGPGMSFVVLSERLYQEKVVHIDPPSLYFDFKDYARNFERGQTPYTPAVRVALELNDMLKHLACQGVDNRVAAVAALAQDFRSRLDGVSGIHLPSYPLSNASTPLLFERENGEEVYTIMKDELGICLTPCGGDLKGKMVRVAHIGNHSIDENAGVVEGLGEALRRAEERERRE